MTKALDREIIDALRLLDAEEKQSLLGVMKSFINLKQKNTERTSIEQYNAEQNAALARVKAGEFYTHEQAMQMVNERLEKYRGED